MLIDAFSDIFSKLLVLLKWVSLGLQDVACRWGDFYASSFAVQYSSRLWTTKCKRDIAIKSFEHRNGFDIVGQATVYSTVVLPRSTLFPTPPQIIEVENTIKFGIFLPLMGDKIYWLKWNLACTSKRRQWTYYPSVPNYFGLELMGKADEQRSRQTWKFWLKSCFCPTYGWRYNAIELSWNLV